MHSDLSRRSMLQVGLGSMLGGKILGSAMGEPVIGGQASGSLAPGAAASAPVSAAAPPIRKALKWGMIGEGGTVREKFEIARDCGFDGIELDSPNDLDADEVLAARDATGVALPGVVDSVHWNRPLSDPDAAVRRQGIEGLRTALRDCRTYGGDSVLLVPAVVKSGVSYADAWTRSQAAIRSVLPEARELGVRIAIENVWNNFLLSPLEAARYTDELDPEVCGWHFDVGNIVAYGWPVHWVEALGSRIRRLDAKGYSRGKADKEGRWAGFGVELDEGDCDWAATMAALRKIPYTGGWLAAEVRGGDRARLTDVARRLDRVLATP